VYNETCNVYTHLIGVLLLPLLATTYMQLLSESQFSSATRADYFMFSLFFWTAECYLVISTLYHLNISHFENGEQFWLRMDLLGIIIVIKGTHISGINYIFPCEPR
jgi:adiponectin receptor